MKKNTVEMILIAAGFVLAAIVPLSIADIPVSAVIYYFIMLTFTFVVLAFLFLSIAKMRISRIEYALSNILLQWSLPADNKAEATNYGQYILLACIGLFVDLGVPLMVLAQMSILSALSISGAISLFSFGLASIAVKRIEEKKALLPDFLLAHNALSIHQNIVILDGMRNAIFETAFEDNTLKLGLKRRRRQIKLSVPVPQEQTENVKAFLEGLSRHFEEQQEELSNGKE